MVAVGGSIAFIEHIMEVICLMPQRFLDGKRREACRIPVQCRLFLQAFPHVNIFIVLVQPAPRCRRPVKTPVKPASDAEPQQRDVSTRAQLKHDVLTLPLATSGETAIHVSTSCPVA